MAAFTEVLFTRSGCVSTQGQTRRYECVWVAAGEEEQQVGRMAILDDGNYHYCMTAMADEGDVLQLRDTWQALFDSFILG